MERAEWRAMVRECLDAEERGETVERQCTGDDGWHPLDIGNGYLTMYQYRPKVKPRWRPLDRYEVGSYLGDDIFNESGDAYRVAAIFEDDRVCLRNKNGWTFDVTLQQLLRYTTADKKPIGILENPE